MFWSMVGSMRRGRRSLPSQPSTLSAIAIIDRSVRTVDTKQTGLMGSRSPFTQRSTWSSPSTPPAWIRMGSVLRDRI